MLRKLSSTAKVMILGGNPLQLPVQMLGFLMAAPELKGHIIKHIGKHLLSNPFNVAEKAAERSVYMHDRVASGHKYGLDLLESGDVITQSKGTKNYKALHSMLMKFVTTGDAISSMIVWDAAVDKATIELNYNMKEAQEYADMIVRTTQGDFSKYSKSMSGLTKEFLPFASFFVTQLNQQRVFRKSDDKAALASFVIMGWLLAPMMEQTIRYAYKSAWSDDEEKTPEEIARMLFQNSLETTAGIYFPGFGAPIAKALTSSDYYATKYNTPLGGLIETGLEVGGDVRKLVKKTVDENEDVDFSDVSRIFTAAGQVAGVIPATQRRFLNKLAK